MSRDICLLLLRVALGLFMLICHGWPKITKFSTLSATFSDPLGIGSMFSLALANFAEAFCAVLLILGIKTRLAAVPIAITML